MSQKLHQVIASSKDIKARTEKDWTEIYQGFKKPDLYSGHTRTYAPINEGGETIQPETKPVLRNAAEQLEVVRAILAEQVNLQSGIDVANQQAVADVVVGGQILLTKVPVNTLLYLEHRLKGVIETLNDAPVLADGLEWVPDSSPGRFRVATPEVTNRTTKTPERFVKAEATDKHPAQVDVIYIDRTVGTWTKVAQSGALLPARRRTLLRRAGSLLDAVKSAREEANTVKVTESTVGSTLADYLFGD